MKTAMIYCSPNILEIVLNSLLVSTQSYQPEVYSLLEVLDKQILFEVHLQLMALPSVWG
jgi:hypothetical protein